MQWSRTARLVILTTIAFMPTVLVSILLWHFDALEEGGPLIVVLLIPTVGWCASRIFSLMQKRTIAIQNDPEADLPPKYEKVMSEPPPYEVLFIGMPLAAASTMCPTLRAAAVNFSREGPRSCFGSAENCTPGVFTTSGSCWPIPAASHGAQNETFVTITKEVKRDGQPGQVSGKIPEETEVSGETAEAIQNSTSRNSSENCAGNSSEDCARSSFGNVARSTSGSLISNSSEDSVRNDSGANNASQEARVEGDRILDNIDITSLSYNERSDPELPSYEEVYQHMSIS
ncbi:uncharacterized protein LOC135213946 [Macrobrachium nipponense]|uniref:uncharacterized protein LOC135213946 n=1 Tax=Macrobrachium nipponense TaxID=159736 RepID=UPI0030C8CDA4